MTIAAEAERPATGAAQRIGFALLIGFATFLTVAACLAFLGASGHAVGFWMANGIPLVALLRTDKDRWPLLVASAFTGNIVAGLVVRPDSLAFAAISSAGNVVQYLFVAWALRRRFGRLFDLLQSRQVVWLCALSVPATLLKGAVQWIGASASGHIAVMPTYPVAWFLSCVLGLFVLSLPLLALSAPPHGREARFDALGFALIGMLTVLIVLVYGPFAFDGMYVVMPPLMLLAWRYGLFGAGLGALLNNVLGSALSLTTEGVMHRLMLLGYGPNEASVFLELFYNAVILISLPVAVARAQHQATDAALAAALASSERRATQLAHSEAAIRANQEVLRQSEQRFRAIYERAPLGIAIIDSETHAFLDGNPMFFEIAGWAREALIGTAWQELTEPEQAEDRMRGSVAFLTGEVPYFQAERTYRRQDGSTVWVNLVVTRIAMPGTERDRFLVMIEDVTERRALQQRLDLVQRLDAIGQLTGGIAHDFNNLLTVIIGSSEALSEELDDPEQRELARLILDTAERAGELTRSLLAFARRQPLSPRALDINQLLAESQPLIRRTLGANLHFSIEMAPDVRPVFADRGQTEAAILNLCLNARDAMPNGGRLTISTQNASFDEAFVRHHSGARPGEYVAVHVSDTGAGIAPEVLDRIFEPFFTTKEKGRGTGLGLAMVYGFTKQSQGYIGVETEEGQGTTFSLYLPVGETNDDPRDGAPLSEPPRGDETILLVEDDALVRAHVQGQLVSLGYRVVEASDGPEALAQLERHSDIALLFTDMMMPGGLNGRELAERARALWPGLKVLFSSGYSNETLMEDGRLIDGITLLSKPYSKRQLAEFVREVLDAAP